MIAENQNELVSLKVNMNSKVKCWEGLDEKNQGQVSEIVKLQQLCQLGAQKNYELVDQNNRLLLKVFQMKLLVSKFIKWVIN